MIVFVGFLFSACGGISTAEQVRIRAANDLRCEASQVQTAQVDASTVRATGCGQERTYVQECTGDSTHCNWRGHAAATAETPAASPQ
ncbi:MAG TPA: hypothetical protein VKE22_02170 [Haliangiales bacterium]|nr:hypothetical protein [Haliangiales bacterium]